MATEIHEVVGNTVIRPAFRSVGHRSDALPGAPAPVRALDVRMPGMDGLDVQRSLAERGARIPIVFVTGQASDEEERCERDEP